MSMEIVIRCTCDGCGRTATTQGSRLAFPNGALPKGWWRCTGAKDLCATCAGSLPTYKPHGNNPRGTQRLPDGAGHGTEVRA